MAPTDQVAGENAARFDTLIADTADRFGLGASAGPLVREVLNMIMGSPGGIGGFVRKFEQAGLGPELAAWLGRRDAPAMSSQLLDRMVGPAAIDAVAGRLGIGKQAASSAIAYVMPKMIGALTPGGTIPTGQQAEAPGRRVASETYGTAAYGSEQRAAGERPAGGERTTTTTYGERTAGGEPRTVTYGERTRAPAERDEQVRPRHIEVIPDEPQLGRWLWPLLGALALLGLGSYLFTANRPAPTPPVTTPAPAPRASVAPSLLPRLVLSNEAGAVNFSGAVHDQESRDTIVNTLKAVFGADKVQGDLEVDANRGAAPWLVNLRTALEVLRVPGVQASFDGNTVNLGGVLTEADRARIADSLKGALGSGLVYGTLADRVASIASEANSSVVSALSSLRPGFTAGDLAGVLNKAIINFPTGGVQVPPEAMALLRSAAAQIRQLPPSTVLEVSGHTDNRGDPTANVKLSQDRAEAVRNVLIQAGLDPTRLVARGYGSANPIASNDLLEGRFRNRRIEFHALRQ
jgi:OOP family OmpA-OmpF porin